ncbi:MAG: hypothetical protein ABR922_03985 [Streptosporangiaceae bacterium]
MHPEMIRAIAAQQIGDQQAAARAWTRAKLARQARKARRHGGNAPDRLDGIRVPDYIDGTFHGEARPAEGTSTQADSRSGAGTEGAGSAVPATGGGRGAAVRRDAA